MVKRVEISRTEQQILDAVRQVRARRAGHKDQDDWCALYDIAEEVRLYASTPGTSKALESLYEKGLIDFEHYINEDGSKGGKCRILPIGETYLPQEFRDATAEVGAARYDIVALTEKIESFAATLKEAVMSKDDSWIASAVNELRDCVSSLSLADERWARARSAQESLRKRYGID